MNGGPVAARHLHLFEGAKERAIRLLEVSELGDILEAARRTVRCEPPGKKKARKPRGFRALIFSEE